MRGETTLSDADRVRPAPNVHVQRLGDEAVLLDFARGDYFALDAVGADIWLALEEGATLREVASGLVARYDVAILDATRDARQLLGELLERGLIVRDKAA